MIPRLDIHFSLCQQWQFMFGKPYTPKNDEFLFNHSRSAIMLVLKATGLPAGAGVGVMAYNCHTVFNAVEQAGYTPVFIDITDDLKLDIEDLRKKVDSISALVVTHLFGLVNDVQRIKKEFPNLIIIEDCAHAYGIEQLYSDFATFSIGQGKLPSIGDGGILCVINQKYLSNVESQYKEMPDYSTRQSVKLFFKLWFNSIMHSRLLYGWITLPLKLKRKVSSGKEIIKPMKMCRGISNIYSFEKDKVKLRNPFMLVLHCHNPKEEQIKYRKKGIDTDTHFANSILWAKEFGYIQGQCQNTEKLINHLLMVPTYFKQ